VSRRGLQRRLRRRWLVLGAAAAVAAATLATGQHYEDLSRTRWPDGAGTLRAADGSDSVGDDQAATASPTAPDKVIALAFADGPDPTWTPQVLDVLHAEDVPATFFVLGSRAAAQPGLVSAEAARGDELGVESFGDVDVSALHPDQIAEQLGATRSIVAGATGIATVLAHLPGTSTAGRLGPRGDLAAAVTVAAGYDVVVADRDARDDGGTVARLTASAMPLTPGPNVVMLHDGGGGDRTRTITALKALVPALRRQGYRFGTVSEVRGYAPPQRAGVAERVRGDLLLAVLPISTAAAAVVPWIVAVMLMVALARAMTLFAVSARRRRPVAPAPPGAEPRGRRQYSAVIPAYNEQAAVARAVRSLLHSTAAPEAVIVVDDGSTDGTTAAVAVVDDARVVVLRQRNQGKAAALRAGIGYSGSAHPECGIVVLVDADTVVEPPAIAALLAHFDDAAVGAVSGRVQVAAEHGFVSALQSVEYSAAFNVERRLYERAGFLPTVPGALGAFRRVALDDVGLVHGDTLAEDTDVTIALQLAGWRVRYEPAAAAWTDAPQTLRALARQRLRWGFGTLQALWKHRRGTRTLRWGGRAMVAYLITFQFLMPLATPLVDIYAVQQLANGSVTVATAWLVLTVAQATLSVVALRADGASLRPMRWLPAHQLVQHHLSAVVVYDAVISAIAGTAVGWNGAPTPEPAAAPEPQRA
jgi:peptidoglycan/xylan/chitin deacetylase (PgdA/CDA1 family)/GT2 family glycosyltransferase